MWLFQLVLGVVSSKFIYTNCDLNDFVETRGIWYISATSITNKPTGSLSDNSGYLECRYSKEIRTGVTVTLQLLYEFDGSAIYERTYKGSEWSEWRRITLDIPTFYKNYADLSSLASALGGLYFSGVIDSGDVNDLDSGIYGVNAQLTNAPQGTGASMLIVMVAGGRLRCDVLFDRANPRILYRFKWGSAGFEEWKEIS